MRLYISKMIIKNNTNDKLSIQNNSNGAKFIIDFNIQNKKKI